MTASALTVARVRRDLPCPGDGPVTLLSTLAAFAIFWWSRVNALELAPTALRAWARYASAGESLRHLIAGARAPNASMPLATLSAAWLAHLNPPPETVRVLFAAPLTALLFMLGAALGPAGVPAFAAAALAAVFHRALFDASPQAAYAVLVLIAACALARREREQTLFRTVVLASVLGASLLFRSALAFLPPLLAARELYSRRRRGAASAAVLFLVPYLFLLPWLSMNWALERRVIPFENGEASCNVVTGALGIVGTVEGPWQALIDEPLDPNSPGAVLSWAARQVARHPFRYAEGVARRLAYVFSLHPFLFLAAFAGFYACRRRADVRALGLLAAYFAGIHCLMSVQETYFTPLWPLLALLAAAGLGRAVEGRASAFEAPLARAGELFCDGAAVLAVAAGLCAGAACAAYADAARSGAAFAPAALDAALSRRPGDAWLNAERGRRRLLERRYPGAADDFDAARGGAMFLEDAYREPMAAARAVMGRADALADAPLEDGGGTALLLAAYGCLRAGDSACALAQLARARALSPALVRGPQDAAAGAALGALRSDETLFASRVAALAAYLPMPAGDALLGLLARAPGSTPAAARAADEWRVVRYQERKQYAQAIALLDRMLAAAPGDGALLGERGLNRWLAGDKARAVRDLEAAIAAAPGELESVLTYAAVSADADPRKALALYDAALARTVPGARLRGEVARHRAELLARHPGLEDGR